MPPYPEDQPPGGAKRSPLALPSRVGDADPHRTTAIWDLVGKNVHKAHGPHRPSYLTEMSSQTAWLPFYWDQYPDDLTKYLKLELFDHSMTNDLEYHGALNWWRGAIRLHPINTTGDGNCLLHAISLALWGVEDVDLKLRKLLFHVMKGEYAGDNEIRWRRERNHFDVTHIPGSGFRYNTGEWSAEWQIVVDITNPDKRPDRTKGLLFECLEEFHIFMMANILRRPIVVLAEDMWRDAKGQSLQPLNFSGIYLPLAWDPQDCFCYPILLGYHQMHFCPLLATAPLPGETDRARFVVPLVVKNDQELLPIHFLKEEEERVKRQLLRKYLVCEERQQIPCANLHVGDPKKEETAFKLYFKLAETRYRIYTEEQFNPENAEVLKAAGVMSARNTQQLDQKVTVGGSTQQEDTQGMNVHIGEGAGVGSGMARAARMDLNEPVARPTPPMYDDLYGARSRSLPNSKLTAARAQVSAFKTIERTSVPAQSSYPGRTNLSKCLTPGCHFFRREETDKYCDNCYKSRPSVGKEAFKKCLTGTCFNSGDRQFGGYCKVCHDQSKFMNEVTLTETRSSPQTVSFGLSSEELLTGAPARPDLGILDAVATAPGTGMSAEQLNACALNTNVINQFEVGSKQCVTPGCQFTGNPKLGHRCHKCHSGKTETTGDAGRLEEGWSVGGYYMDALPSNVVPAIGMKKCLMPECELTGHPDKGDLCSGCFTKQQTILLENNASSPIPESPSKLPAERQKQLWDQVASRKCLTTGCEMFAHPSQNGLCSKCYKKSIEGKSSGPQSPSRGGRPQHPTLQAAANPASAFTPVLKFTVQKNMCATPGCNGVRTKLGDGDLCLLHHQERVQRYSPGAQASPPVGGAAGAVGLVSVTAGRAQPSAPPPSFPVSAIPTSKAAQQDTLASQMTKPTDAHICAHPKCNNQATPPLMVACKSCLDFVEKVNQVHVAISSMRSQGPKPETRVFPSIESKAEPKVREAVATQLEAPSDSVSNLNLEGKISPERNFQNDHVKRQACKARRGCPFGLDGDVNYGNLCSKCFDRDVVGRHHGSNSSPLAQVQSPFQFRHPDPPRSKSDVLPGKAMATTKSSASHRPSNFMKCHTSGCHGQANPQILEGYCDNCYPAYRNIEARTTSPPRSSSDPTGRRSKAKAAQEEQELRTTEVGAKAPKCHNPRCQNFGNSHCRGYCNGCYKKLRVDRDFV